MTDNIKWKEILSQLVEKIKEADDKSYSINLLEEVKMANKYVRKKNKGNGEKSSLDVNVNENANSRILAKLFQYKSPDGKYEILQSLLNYICVEKRISDFGIVINDKPIITTEETLRQDTGNEIGKPNITTEETLTQDTGNEIGKPNITTKETLTQDNGRIDILVRTGSNAIIFENKLFKAGDQDNQLARYIDKVKDVKGSNGKSQYNDENIFVIYLSRDGDEPADNSWEIPLKTDTKPSGQQPQQDESGKNSCKKPEINPSYLGSFANRYANLSFKDDILPWLKNYVLPNVRKKDTDLESALVQYINYLERMFMKNNYDLTNWLEEKLEKEEEEEGSKEPDHMVKTLCLEKVEGLIATLKKGQLSRSKISVKKLKDFINSETNEDLLNKVIAVIENLRDDCRDEVLKPFYTVSEKTNNSEDNSKGYFDKSHLSHPTAEYCILQNKKWEDIKFQWQPFFISDEKEEHLYKFFLEIILTENDKENKKRINKFETVQNAINNMQIEVLNSTINEVKKINGVKNISYKKEFKNNNNNSKDVSKKKKQRGQRLLQIDLKTNKKLLYFDPKVQEALFRAIYGSLLGIINAIDDVYSKNPA